MANDLFDVLKNDHDKVKTILNQFQNMMPLAGQLPNVGQGQDIKQGQGARPGVMGQSQSTGQTMSQGQTTGQVQISRQRIQSLLESLNIELRPHMEGEERAFYPVLRDIERSRMLALMAMEEHMIAKRILDELNGSNVGTQEWLAKIIVFKDVIEHHIKEEEGKIFDIADDVLDDNQKRNILNQFNDVKNQVRSQVGKTAESTARQQNR